MCVFTRHVCQAPDYFMFPEGYVTLNVHECYSNWKILHPSPRKAMRVVAEYGTPYIYYLWREHHLDVLECIEELTYSQSCLALMVHAMVDQYMWHYYHHIHGASFLLEHIAQQLGQ